MPASERGGVTVSFILRTRVKLALWRSLGDLPAFFACWWGAWSAVSECWGGGGRWVARVAVMLLLMAAASKGLPTRSSAVRSECWELAAEGAVAAWDDSEKPGLDVWRRTSEGGEGEGEGCGAWW